MFPASCAVQSGAEVLAVRVREADDTGAEPGALLRRLPGPRRWVACDGRLTK